jgi:hypothetical protein
MSVEREVLVTITATHTMRIDLVDTTHACPESLIPDVPYLTLEPGETLEVIRLRPAPHPPEENP